MPTPRATARVVRANNQYLSLMVSLSNHEQKRWSFDSAQDERCTEPSDAPHEIQPGIDAMGVTSVAGFRWTL